MRHPYHKLIKELESKRKPVLATIIATRGSAPQVPGASALFSGGKILSGTLGGGILEGDATCRAEDVLKKGYSLLYEFDLDDDLSGEGAICGGSATILLDSSPGKNIKAFKDLQESILNGIPGVLVTLIRVKNQVEIERYWVQQGEQTEKRNWEEWEDIYAEMATCLRRDSCWFKEKPDGQSIFLEPVHPLPELIIAGAGHVGKALAHMASVHGTHPQLLKAVMDINQYQRRQTILKLREVLGSKLRGKVVGLLGLAFKPNTDDTRDSPAAEVGRLLLHEGVQVKGYDPVAMPNAARLLPG